jgi:hypothetical protein
MLDSTYYTKEADSRLGRNYADRACKHVLNYLDGKIK